MNIQSKRSTLQVNSNGKNTLWTDHSGDLPVAEPAPGEGGLLRLSGRPSMGRRTGEDGDLWGVAWDLGGERSVPFGLNAYGYQRAAPRDSQLRQYRRPSLALEDFRGRYNHQWLIEHHNRRSPAQVRQALLARFACSNSRFFSWRVCSKRLRSVLSRAATNTPCSLLARS